MLCALAAFRAQSRGFCAGRALGATQQASFNPWVLGSSPRRPTTAPPPDQPTVLQRPSGYPVRRQICSARDTHGFGRVSPCPLRSTCIAMSSARASPTPRTTLASHRHRPPSSPRSVAARARLSSWKYSHVAVTFRFGADQAPWSCSSAAHLPASSYDEKSRLATRPRQRQSPGVQFQTGSRVAAMAMVLQPPPGSRAAGAHRVATAVR
jgi:hypothetical protein